MSSDTLGSSSTAKAVSGRSIALQVGNSGPARSKKASETSPRMKPFDVVMFSALIFVMCEAIYDGRRLKVGSVFRTAAWTAFRIRSFSAHFRMMNATTHQSSAVSLPNAWSEEYIPGSGYTNAIAMLCQTSILTLVSYFTVLYR
jgi:hypothetical protein